MAEEIIVKDINMSFGSMVVFMVKWSIAAIPAMFILTIIGGILALLFGGMFAGLAGLAALGS